MKYIAIVGALLILAGSGCQGKSAANKISVFDPNETFTKETTSNVPRSPVGIINNQAEKEFEDCSGNFTCFVYAALGCKLVQTTDSQKMDTKQGVVLDVVIEQKILGREGNQCLYYMKYSKLDLIFDDAALQKLSPKLDKAGLEFVKNGMRSDYGYEGTDLTCKFKVDELSELLRLGKKIETIKLVFPLYLTDCKGSYSDYVKSVVEKKTAQIQQRTSR